MIDRFAFTGSPAYAGDDDGMETHGGQGNSSKKKPGQLARATHCD